MGAEFHAPAMHFYPRPPRGGRLVMRKHRRRKCNNFYPRPPRGGRLFGVILDTAIAGFLSTPSARRATQGLEWTLLCILFLSTPSARRATSALMPLDMICLISIHALREEGDLFSSHCAILGVHFYPRPPRGGRQQKQRENPLLLSHYTPPCTNCKEVPVKQTAKSHRYLCKRLIFRCEASGKTMCAACSHWRGIKRSAHYPAQTPGAAQHARP